MNKLGIYIHIPFCLSRCRYCGFYSNAMDETSGSLEAQKTYVQWLIGKIRDQGARYGRKYAVDTIFIGGGTPSILSVEMIEAIIGAVRESFAIESGAEITIESNPKTLTPQKLKRYRMAGINRLSIGLQSFDDDILRSLGRAHNVEDFMFSHSYYGFRNRRTFAARKHYHTSRVGCSTWNRSGTLYADQFRAYGNIFYRT